MFKPAILLLYALAICAGTSGQLKMKIKKGRRNKSESQFMLDENYFQAEWEVGHETITGQLNTTVYPNLLLRYGISKQVEVNVEMNLLTAYDESAGIKNSSGIEPVSIGASCLLLTENKNIPAVIFSGQLALPFLAGKNFTANYLAPSLQLMVEKAINKKIMLLLSNGVFWDGFSTTGSYMYNGAVSCNAAKKWTFTSEWFGFINGSAPQHNTDVSISFMVNRNWQLGVTSGIGLSPQAHKSYVGVNAVWGCSMKKNRQQALLPYKNN